ncbi:hypothetical protein [Nocardioides conyzicola]|uniref:Secreted protein n=1 Tax=Nocardioides conyzicola TaxID=1651781 RepID=A0ABP8WKA3_9ACTN
MDALVAAAIGFVTAAVLAMVNSWLSGREHVAEGVRTQRMATYPAVWKRTGVVSRWPRTDAGREEFLRLHEDLRTWYYGAGGLYLSSRARARYEHLQVVLDAVLSMDEEKAAQHYQAVREAASYFRTGLTDDLETRQRSGIVVAVSRRRADGRADRKADERLRRVKSAGSAGTPPIRAVEASDEDLAVGPTPTE